MSAWRPPTTKAEQRDLLDQLIQMQRHAMELGGDRLQRVLDGLIILRTQMSNRSPEQRGRVSADAVTPQKRADVLRLRHEQPKLSQQEIANRLNLNVGRVSEILHGKRGE
jgi:hypothetical protein